MPTLFRARPVMLAVLVLAPAASLAQPASPGLAAALRAARPGETLRLPAGEFFECGVVVQDGLVIEGAGMDATVLSDQTCEGKAVLVIRGRGVVVRDLTLARARVPDGNGAGIRAEGEDLTVERVRFDNNQVGIMAGGMFRGRMNIRDSVFQRDGVTGGERPMAAILVQGGSLLRLERVRVEEGRGGAALISDAEFTDIRGGAFLRPAAPRGATLQVSRGLRLEGAQLEAGLMPSGQLAAVLALGGAGPLTLQGNRMAGQGALLLNWSGATPSLANNQLERGAEYQSSAGSWRHWASTTLRGGYAAARRLAGRARNMVKQMLSLS